MRVVEVKYAGVTLSSVPREYLLRNPGKRINYFEIPWCASVPGHGRVLVTNEQRLAIEDVLRQTKNGYADLELYCKDADSNGETTPVDSVILKKIVLMAAYPVWGETFTEVDKKNNSGLWELELQDYRTIYLMKLMDIPGNKGNQLAVFNAKGGTGGWIHATVKTGSDGTSVLPFMWNEIVYECFHRVGQSLGFTPVKETYPENLNLSGIPAILAGDILVAHHSSKIAVRYSPISDSFFVSDENMNALFDNFEGRKIYGGFSRVYPASIPQNIYRYTPSDSGLTIDEESLEKPSVKNFMNVESVSTAPQRPADTNGIGETISDTVIPFYDRYRIATGTESSYSRRTIPQFHGAYHGFIKEFVTERVPLSLVRYSWLDVPFTEVHSGVQSPIRTILNGPCAHFLRDTPLRLSIDGDLSLPHIFSKERIIRAKIITLQTSFMTCTPVDELNNTIGSSLVVAYPWDIISQRIPGWNYQWTSPQTRTLSKEDYTENQAITPPYQPGDYIFITKPMGKSGHKVSNVMLEWIDINQGGKAWAKVTT